MKNNILKNYCNWNNSQDVKTFLSKNSDLDVLHNEGMCFKLALKNSNAQVMSLLLEYYERQNLTGDDNSIEYKVARHNLQQVLENVLQFYEATPEIYQVMNKYLPINKSSDDKSDSENLGDFDYFTTDEDTNKAFFYDKFAEVIQSGDIPNTNEIE